MSLRSDKTPVRPGSLAGSLASAGSGEATFGAGLADARRGAVPRGRTRAGTALGALGGRVAGRMRVDVTARPRWWGEALVIAWLCWLYDIVAGAAPLREPVAIAHGWGVLHLEQALHLAPELALNRWLAPHHALALALSDYYDNAHFVVTLGLLGWLWWRFPVAYRPLRNALVLVNVLGLAVFWLFPMAPPRLLAGAGFTDVVAATHAIGSWHSGSLASNADQLAAMPSLHIAWAAWCVLAVWRVSRRRWVRALALAHLVATSFAVLATGNHFLADVLAGFATLALAAWCVHRASVLLGARNPCHKVVTKSASM